MTRLRRHAEPSRTLAEALLRKAAGAAVLVAVALTFHAAAGVEYARHVAHVSYDLTNVPTATPIVDPAPAPGTTPTHWYALPPVTQTATGGPASGRVGGIGGTGQTIEDYAASQALVWAGESKDAEDYRLCVRLAEIKPYLELVCVPPTKGS